MLVSVLAIFIALHILPVFLICSLCLLPKIVFWKEVTLLLIVRPWLFLHNNRDAWDDDQHDSISFLLNSLVASEIYKMQESILKS